MNAEKLQVRLYVDGHAAGTPFPLEPFIPVFHGWIKHHTLKELLVDVANYAHVPSGPGVALIGHGYDYYVEETEGRPALLFSRKREAPPPAERLADTFRRAFHGAALLEKEQALGGKLRFRTDELLFRVNDRLAAPNSEETFAEVRPELEALCTKLFAGAPFKLTLAARPRQLFSVRITTDGKHDLATLLDRAGGPLA
jgi:hypothetical protein